MSWTLISFFVAALLSTSCIRLLCYELRERDRDRDRDRETWWREGGGEEVGGGGGGGHSPAYCVARSTDK